MSAKDGGPAFPRPVSEVHRSYTMADKGPTKAQDGMSLRDYFAGQALLAVISKGFGNEVAASDKAYRYADAMLAARGVPERDRGSE